MFQLLLLLTFSTTSLGRIEPTSYGDDIINGDPMIQSDGTATVCKIISLLEKKSSSLSKGVLVVAANWTDDVPHAFLRTLQARHDQPVYTVRLDRLLAEGRKLSEGWWPDHDGPGYNFDDRVRQTNRSLPVPCRRPIVRGPERFMLPLRSRYVVLFQGPGPLGPFAELADIKYTFWDVNVYYLFVARGFDQDLRKMVYGVWRNLAIYKYEFGLNYIFEGLFHFFHLPIFNFCIRNLFKRAEANTIIIFATSIYISII